MENSQEQFEKAEIFNSPQDLMASMASESQQSEPQVEAQPEPQPEQPQESAYVDPEATPSEEPTTLEQITEAAEPQVEPQQESYQQPQEENYSDEEIEAAVYTYLSERLGREINSFDELNTSPAMDERVQAIADFVSETGRKPEDWFTYQSMNPSEMDDLTVVRVQMSQQYPNLSFEEINMLVGNKYKLDTSVYDDNDVQLSMLQLKIDATDARGNIEKIRETYKAPLLQETATPQPESGFTIDDDWMRSMATETEAMEALEFDLGGDKTFTYAIGDDHRRRLIQRNSQIDNFFDGYVNGDGSWDYDKMNSHFAVIDNIDTIVASAYRQGLGDGQKAVVSNAANISSDTSPSSSQNLNEANPLAQQVSQLLRANSSKMTFNI
jgi:hypothetical protein